MRPRFPEAVRRLRSIALVASARAAHVVQQLLTLARAEPEGGPIPRLEPVKLSDLVGQAVADHALLAEARRIDLGSTGAVDGMVDGDPAALRTLLANLVDNAVRYAPEGGRVDVSAGFRGDRPFLQVADGGPGIPEHERERLSVLIQQEHIHVRMLQGVKDARA